MNSQNDHQKDTIAALATPPGRGGIAVVRVSGVLVSRVIREVTQLELKPREATRTVFFDAREQAIDEGIAIFFKAPHSFTGEDVLELQGHSGPVINDLLLQRLIELGVRIAKPGEFSERAFLNGKIDLTQAEAIADLIDSTSKQAAQLAMRSLQGEFSRIINNTNEKIVKLRMYIEAAIDFSDEEIDFLQDHQIHKDMMEILSTLQEIQNKAKQGSFLREGITAVIIGKPNVGKSSLLNCLSGKDLAIVTDIPGTTRDVLRDYILIDNMPMQIVDTAGLRESTDLVEQEGIKRAQQEIQLADLILYVLNANETSETIFVNKNEQQKLIYIRNKIDLTNETPSKEMIGLSSVVSISVKENLGINLLKQEIKRTVGFNNENEGIYLARRRHLDALNRAEKYINQTLEQFINRREVVLMAEDLRSAHLALCEITGEFTADDLLGKIFSSFCIGK